MAAPPDRIERLRTRIAETIQHGTDLVADLKALPEGFQLLLPSLDEIPRSQRDTEIARVCGYDETLPERLATLVESLADVLAGLTTADGGEAWLRRQLARLDMGEDLQEG